MQIGQLASFVCNCIFKLIVKFLIVFPLVVGVRFDSLLSFFVLACVCVCVCVQIGAERLRTNSRTHAHRRVRKEIDSVRSKLIQQVHNYIQINNMYVGVSVRV